MKFLIRAVLVLAFLFVAVCGLSYFMFDGAVAAALRDGTSYATGTETEVESVNSGLFSGNFAVNGLAIQNPVGFRDEPFLAMGTTGANWKATSVLSDHIQIERLALDSLVLNLELDGSRKNFDAIMERLRSLAPDTPETGPGAESEDEAPTGKEKRLTVDLIEITNVKIGVHAQNLPVGNGDTEVEVAKIQLQDFSTEGEPLELVGKLVRTIVEAVLQSSLDVGPGVLPAGVLDALEGDLGGLRAAIDGEASEALEGLKQDVSEKLDEALQGVDLGESGEELKKSAENALEGLFGGKKKD